MLGNVLVQSRPNLIRYRSIAALRLPGQAKLLKKKTKKKKYEDRRNAYYYYNSIGRPVQQSIDRETNEIINDVKKPNKTLSGG